MVLLHPGGKMKNQNVQKIFGPQNEAKGSPTSWLLLHPSILSKYCLDPFWRFMRIVKFKNAAFMTSQ